MLAAREGDEAHVLFRVAGHAIDCADWDRALELVEGRDDLRAIAHVSTMAARVAAATWDGATALPLVEYANGGAGVHEERLRAARDLASSR